MSFNRRGGYDRRPDRPERRDRSDRPDRGDRPPRREGGDWQPRERGTGGGGYGARSGPGAGGGGRAYGQRGRFDRADEGGMSIRLDPRRLGHLKQLAGEAGLRPGDLVRQWVEERIDAERGGTPGVPSSGIAGQLEELVARVSALEAASGMAPAPIPEAESTRDAAEAPTEHESADAPAGEGPAEEPVAAKPRTRAKRVAAAPRERVALHDEMIAVIRERGPMSAGDLAAAISERGRYAPPRSGKPLDAAMVSQRVSNPTYRARFTRDGGLIGLAEIEGT